LEHGQMLEVSPLCYLVYPPTPPSVVMGCKDSLLVEIEIGLLTSVKVKILAIWKALHRVLY
jgi:hypothetical protein